MSRISSMARYMRGQQQQNSLENGGPSNKAPTRSRSNTRLFDRISSRGNSLVSRLVHHAFEHATSYDETLSYMRRNLYENGGSDSGGAYGISYGEAALDLFKEPMPIKVLNGSPGYLAILDALNAWQLVSELAGATRSPAAASFKQVSPSGAAIGVPLSKVETQVYMVADLPLDAQRPSLAAAAVRARGVDRMTSFGDFIALSQKCDELTARIINREMSDGVIAPDYEDAALSILAKKRGGNYTVLRIEPKFLPSETEERSIFGLRLRQKRRPTIVNVEQFSNIVSNTKHLPKSALDDLIVASVAVKYAQANSVCYVHRGQVIGLGAGQQTRVHCVRLAGEKAASWWLRQHEKVLGLPWKPTLKRSERSNAVDLIVSGVLEPQESLDQWLNNFTEPFSPFTQEERSQWIAKMHDVALSSDALLPSRDCIDCAQQFGVKYVACPGAEDDVVQACDEYGITLIRTASRVFHH